MDGLWVLLVLMFTAALPVLLVHIWFKVKRFPISLPWFLLSLLAGALTPPLALMIQHFLPLGGVSGRTSLINALLWFFIRIALTEEASRFLTLFLLFRLKSCLYKKNSGGLISGLPEVSLSILGAASGLLSGLGFAVVENTYYGAAAADIGITLIRGLTAAPLHGACGARVGYAAMMAREAPGRALTRFLAAAVIHGMYNFMLLSPGIPPVFPIIIALTALAASIQAIHRAWVWEDFPSESPPKPPPQQY